MDMLKDLQTDDSVVSDNDKYVITTIFNHERVPKNYHVKHVVIASLLFSVLSLPRLDEWIDEKLRVSNCYYKLGVKASIFFVFYFLIINYVVKYEG